MNKNYKINKTNKWFLLEFELWGTIIEKILFILTVLRNIRFNSSSSIVRYLSRLQSHLSYSCTLKFLKIQRMISSLLIVLVNSGGSHWLLATLPFIRELCPHQIKWKWRNVGVTYKILEVWSIPTYPFPTGTTSISFPPLSQSHLLYRKDFTLLSSQLG